VQPVSYSGPRPPGHTGPPLYETSPSPPRHLAKWPVRASARPVAHPTTQSPLDSAAFANHAHVRHPPFHMSYPLHNPLAKGEILFFLLFTLPSQTLLSCFCAPLCSTPPSTAPRSQALPSSCASGWLSTGVLVFILIILIIQKPPGVCVFVPDGTHPYYLSELVFSCSITTCCASSLLSRIYPLAINLGLD
jgi:hypothetical protein